MMNKGLKAAVAVILSVWIFLMGFELGSYKEKREMQSAAPETGIASTPATQPSSAEPTTAAPATTVVANDPFAAEKTEAPTGTTTAPALPAPASMTKEQILQQVSLAMQKLEQEQSMTARKVEKSSVTVTECSAQALIGVINSMLNRNLVDDTLTYRFSGGQAVGYDQSGKPAENGAVVSPAYVLPPEKASFSLQKDGVADATAKKQDSEIVYTLKIKPETASIIRPIPPHNAASVGYLDLTTLDLPGVTIEDADMQYTGSVFTLTVGADGRATKLDLYLPMHASGKARLALLSGSATFEGNKIASWTFAY